MNVLVLGAGLAGVASAWYLRQRGFAVAVLDLPSDHDPLAHVGAIATSYAWPWPVQARALAAIKRLWQGGLSAAVLPSADYPGLWPALRYGFARRSAMSQESLLQLALYSHDCLQALQQSTGIEYASGRLGSIQLLRTGRQLDAAMSAMQQLTQNGVASRLLPPDEIPEFESVLHGVGDSLLGALYVPAGQSGDAELFRRGLMARARAQGVEFRVVDKMDGLISEADRVHGVLVDGQLERADHYVLALDAQARPLLNTLGIELSLYPRYCYSLAYESHDADMQLQSLVVDSEMGLLATRVANRLQISTLADCAVRPRQLMQAASRLLGTSFVLEPVDFSTEVSYLMPDAAPQLGPSSYANLWLNLGHSGFAWSMACGAGRYVADLIGGTNPAIGLAGLSPFSRAARG